MKKPVAFVKGFLRQPGLLATNGNSVILGLEINNEDCVVVPD